MKALWAGFIFCASIASAANNGYLTAGQQVASNTQILGQGNALVGGPTDSPVNATRLETRIQMFADAKTAIDIRLIYPTYYLAPAYTAMPSTMTVQAAVEYNGTTTPVTFQGASTITLSPRAGMFISDPISPGIPAGAMFYVRTGVTIGAGSQIMIGYTQLANINDGVLSTNATSQVDNTGPLSLGATGVVHASFGPCAVIGRVQGHPLPAALVWGDSIANAPPDANGNESFYTWGLRAATTPLSYINASRSSVGFFHTSPPLAPAQLTLFNYTTHAITELGVNDLQQPATGSTTLAAIEANALATWAAMKGSGLKVYQTLITPKTSSTDSWATAANQTPAARFGIGQDRDLFNIWIKARAADSTIDGYIDIPSVWEDQANLGKWVSNGTANYATSDGLHPSSVMQTIAQPIITALANSWLQ